jgi:hypothetical protein
MIMEFRYRPANMGLNDWMQDTLFINLVYAVAATPSTEVEDATDVMLISSPHWYTLDVERDRFVKLWGSVRR